MIGIFKYTFFKKVEVETILMTVCDTVSENVWKDGIWKGVHSTSWGKLDISDHKDFMHCANSIALCVFFPLWIVNHKYGIEMDQNHVKNMSVYESHKSPTSVSKSSAS